MRLIVGLGNPGEEYAGTYHNVGFRVLDRIAAAQGTRIKERCGPALISGKVVLGGQTAVLVLPQTYMNKSGAAMPPVFERFESGAQDMIVVYDDLALPLGKLRVRQKGSAGGHNGIKSLISTLGSDEFLGFALGFSRTAKSVMSGISFCPVSQRATGPCWIKRRKSQLKRLKT
jgi:PTH1 family peptidyl-tRNA hydrolase